MDQRKCARQALILMLMALMFVVDMSDPCTNMQKNAQLQNMLPNTHTIQGSSGRQMLISLLLDASTEREREREQIEMRQIRDTAREEQMNDKPRPANTIWERRATTRERERER